MLVVAEQMKANYISTGSILFHIFMKYKPFRLKKKKLRHFTVKYFSIPLRTETLKHQRSSKVSSMGYRESGT